MFENIKAHARALFFMYDHHFVVNDRYRNRQIRYADIHADNRILSDLLQFPNICMSADLHCICRYDLYLQIMRFNLQMMEFVSA